MKDLIKMKDYLQAEKEHYSAKAKKLKALGGKATQEEIEVRAFYYGKVSALDEVIKAVDEMIKEDEFNKIKAI